ncbi:zinc ribbon domain-containing protein [bacterium]|nr:zinc ribbon domain-containing protein [bacterium]
MPTYEYRCDKCGEFEFVQKISEDALKTCPTCGAKVERLLSGGAFHLKGSGWYKTDYSGSSSSGSTKKPTASSEKSAETSSTETSSSTNTTKKTDSGSGSGGSGGCGGGCSCH